MREGFSNHTWFLRTKGCAFGVCLGVVFFLPLRMSSGGASLFYREFFGMFLKQSVKNNAACDN